MQIEHLASAEDVARATADLVAEVVAHKPEAVLVLPAGRTPVPLYCELVRRRIEASLDLSESYLFQLDELVGVAPLDERSFRGFLRRHLLEPLGRGSRRVHLLDGTAPDPIREIEHHQHRLSELGAADLVVLGLGRNGHVAFNEPGSVRTAGARVVDLAPETRDSFAGAFSDREIPRRGMTLGLSDILAARRIALLVTGASKAGVLAEVLRGDPTPRCPASFLCDHAGLRLFVDSDAAKWPERGRARASRPCSLGGSPEEQD